MIDAILHGMINECCKTGISVIRMMLKFIGTDSVQKFKPVNQ